MRNGWLVPVGLAAVLAGAGAAPGDDQREGMIRESVVKISATLRNPDLVRPWMKQSPQEASGTGVVIEGRRILTNAHVVLYASQLFVETSQSGDKRRAMVEAVSPGMDLAVVKLEDESFFDGRPPLTRSEALPQIKDSIHVYGYPQGGSTLSITKGIVSRIEFVPYNDGVSGLRVQVDAAINPGNSGGPALVDDAMVGLIFSKLVGRAESIGYIIPSEEIDLFLKDVADGHYDGKPALRDELQTLENEALRGMLGLDRKANGMVVHAPEKDDADYPLKEWDLIARIGDHDVDNVGMVRLGNGLRVRFQYLVQKLADNGKVPLSLIRKGEPINVELPVSKTSPRLIDALRGRYPSYFVFGPLVFAPATSDLLARIDGLSSALSQMGSPLASRRSDKPKFEGEELVVVSAPMFPHRISVGYSNPFTKVVKDINGIRIKNIRHLVETLRDTKEKYVTISFDDRASETIVFNRQEVLAATDEILTDNGVRQAASDDLRAVWEKSQ